MSPKSAEAHCRRRHKWRPPLLPPLGPGPRFHRRPPDPPPRRRRRRPRRPWTATPGPGARPPARRPDRAPAPEPARARGRGRAPRPLDPRQPFLPWHTRTHAQAPTYARTHVRACVRSLARSHARTCAHTHLNAHTHTHTDGGGALFSRTPPPSPAPRASEGLESRRGGQVVLAAAEGGGAVPPPARPPPPAQAPAAPALRECLRISHSLWPVAALAADSPGRRPGRREWAVFTGQQGRPEPRRRGRESAWRGRAKAPRPRAPKLQGWAGVPAPPAHLPTFPRGAAAWRPAGELAVAAGWPVGQPQPPRVPLGGSNDSI